jgi:rhamnosyltransferase subunit B
MHFLMSALGSAGDVHPFIALGQALQRRGHEVELLASPWFQARIEAAGLGFLPVGEVGDYERIVRLPGLWSPLRGFALLVRELLAGLLAAHAVALPRVRPDTVLVGSTLAWHLRLLQEQLGNPGATLHLSPMCLFSGASPPRLPGLGGLDWLPPTAARAVLSAVEGLFLDPLVAPALNRVRARLGLPPVRRVMSGWLHSPDLVIAAWPEWFAPPQPDWPPQAVVTGFPFFLQPGVGTTGPDDALPERPGSLGSVDALDPLAQFLAAGPPPVGITPGSAMAHGRGFFAKAVAACRALGLRAVLVTPYADQLPNPLPPNCLHLPYVPFQRLVPRLAALVHHGGIGTCAQALAAGVPQLVCAFAHDQFDNAHRLQRLGVGRHVGRYARTARWTEALALAVGSAEVAERCAQAAVAMRHSRDAADDIAQRLEALGARRGA